MKRYLYILLLLFISDLSVAQDVQRFAERHIMGTARYVGMGGAMTAIGGDPSAVLDNPAGLGLYRSSELSISLDMTADNTQQCATDLQASADVYSRSRFAISQASGVWAWGNPSKQKGLIYSNLMLAVNRRANYNRDVYVQGGAMGMLSTICGLTNGLDEKYLQNMPWDDTEIGWLSILGYEGYLIDPVRDLQWVPAVDMTHGSLSVSETGSADEYVLSWAANISNQWYVGVNMNVPSLNYTKHITFRENDRINQAEIKSMYHVSGLGVGASVGVIYRPVQYLRVGASLQTPTVMSLSMQTEGDLRSSFAGQEYNILTPESGTLSVEMQTPLRTSVSVAGQMNDWGMLALQYDYAYSSEMDDVHTLRLGAEAQVYRGLFVNAGYVYESSFVKNEVPIGLNYNSIRTDMDYRYTPNSQYISAAIGYRGHAIIAQLAYQYRLQSLHQFASEMQGQAMDVMARTHRIVATLAWKL